MKIFAIFAINNHLRNGFVGGYMEKAIFSAFFDGLQSKVKMICEF